MFQVVHKNKCPSKIIKKIIKNAYKAKLPGDCIILPTFKVKDLRPYHGEDLRTSLFFFPNNRGGKKKKKKNQDFFFFFPTIGV